MAEDVVFEDVENIEAALDIDEDERLTEEEILAAVNGDHEMDVAPSFSEQYNRILRARVKPQLDGIKKSLKPDFRHKVSLRQGSSKNDAINREPRTYQARFNAEDVPANRIGPGVATPVEDR
jgi:hypothetical protein